MGFVVWTEFKSQLHQLPGVLLWVNHISAPTFNSRVTSHPNLLVTEGYPGILDFKAKIETVVSKLRWLVMLGFSFAKNEIIALYNQNNCEE